MSTLLERKEQIFSVWCRDPDTGDEYTAEISAFTQFDAIIGVHSSWSDKDVDFSKYTFSAAEKLVLEHVELQQRVRDKILDLSVHTNKLASFQESPERTLQKRLKLLYELEQPKRVTTIYDSACSGCGKIIPAKSNRVLRVRGGNCCNNSCYALMLAAKQPHGS